MPKMLGNESWLCEPMSPHAQVRGFRYVLPFELWVRPWLAVWWQRHWTLGLWLALLYVMAVVGGQRLMRGRPALHLRRPLLAWNMTIAAYSLLTGGRVATEILAQIRHDGFLASLCQLGPAEHQKLVGTYALFFTLSKVLELGDTAFLVLRRKPVPFLHCFHHTLVMLFTWMNAGFLSVVNAYFMAMNLLVHFLIYSYLSLKMLRVPVPVFVAPLLTALELSHALACFGLTFYATRVQRAGVYCCLATETTNSMSLAYAIFALVFCTVVAYKAQCRMVKCKAKSD